MSSRAPTSGISVGARSLEPKACIRCSLHEGTSPRFVVNISAMEAPPAEKIHYIRGISRYYSEKTPPRSIHSLKFSLQTPWFKRIVVKISKDHCSNTKYFHYASPFTSLCSESSWACDAASTVFLSERQHEGDARDGASPCQNFHTLKRMEPSHANDSARPICVRGFHHSTHPKRKAGESAVFRRSSHNRQK